MAPYSPRWSQMVPVTVIMSAGMGVSDKYNASYSIATHQKIQTLSSVSQSVSQLFTSSMGSTPLGQAIMSAGMGVPDKYNASYGVLF